MTLTEISYFCQELLAPKGSPELKQVHDKLFLTQSNVSKKPATADFVCVKTKALINEFTVIGQVILFKVTNVSFEIFVPWLFRLIQPFIDLSKSILSNFFVLDREFLPYLILSSQMTVNKHIFGFCHSVIAQLAFNRTLSN